MGVTKTKENQVIMADDYEHYKDLLHHALHKNNFHLTYKQSKTIINFIYLLFEWSDHYNLTAHKKVKDIIYKDIIDNLYLSLYIDHNLKNCSNIIDLGCGAGFTGLVLKIAQPHRNITFLDSSRKRINFVKQVCREFLIDAEFVMTRAEKITPEYQSSFDLCVSRATWPIVTYAKLASKYVQNNGHIIYLSGKDQPITPELKQAYQAEEGVKEYFYEIEPYGFSRKLFILKN